MHVFLSYHFSGPTTVMSEGTKNILEGMKEHGVKRVSCCISCKLISMKNSSVILTANLVNKKINK